MQHSDDLQQNQSADTPKASAPPLDASEKQPLAVNEKQPPDAPEAKAQQIDTPEAKAQKAASSLKKEAASKKDSSYFHKFVFKMQRGVNDAAAHKVLKTQDRLPWRVVYNAFGQLFYRVGLQTEYLFVTIVRLLMQWLFVAAQGVVLVLAAVVLPVGRYLHSVWMDLSEPVVQTFLGFAHIFQAIRQGRAEGQSTLGAATTYLRDGAHLYRRLWLGAASYLLPVGAMLVFVLTVWSVLENDFSLRVEYNGEVIGFVESESVWEDAQTLIRARIKATGEDETWDATPTFYVVSVDTSARSVATDLADTIMMKSPDKVQQATGVYVDETLIGVCEESQTVQALIDTALAQAQEDLPDGRAELLHDVQLVSGWYFTSSLTSADAVQEILTQNDYLSIKVVQTQTYEESIPYNTIEQANDTYYEGTTRTSQYGADGVKTVVADVVYVNGVEVERHVLEETVIQEAVDKIVQVGTMQYSGTVVQVGTGTMLFPVPDYSYITTTFGQGGHRGVDICAPAGTPIYACDGGVVTESGWHYSWGNYVKIDHGNGTSTLYAHCTQLYVGTGQAVTIGQMIGTVGSTGNSSGNHLHLEMYVNGSLVDPFLYVSP